MWPNATKNCTASAKSASRLPKVLFALCFPAGGVSTVPAAVCRNGVMDYALHPMEPLAVRLTLAKTF